MLKAKPKIEFIEKDDLIRFEGIFIIKSLWEEDENLYHKISDFLRERESINIEFKVFYFDSVSRKIFFELFMRLSDELNSMKMVNIEWYYEEEDESILELGKVLSDNLALPFEFIQE